VQEVQVAPALVAYALATSDSDEGEIPQALRSAYAKVAKFIAAHNLKQAGAAFTINLKWAKDGYESEAAIPLTRAPDDLIPPDSPVKIKQAYSGKALKAVHDGPYLTLEVTLQKLTAYAAAYGYEPAAASWNQLDGNPMQPPGLDRASSLFLPVK
jgi:effector-binding domain-containing protein